MKYSVIIPAHNEEQNLTPLMHELDEVMTQLHLPWEVIVIDDGSTDRTWDILSQNTQTLPQLRGLRLKQQSGQTAALDVGIHHARGEILITLDGDGQNDPHDIPLLLSALHHGIDCVSGWRVDRHDSWDRRFISSCANGLRRWLLGDTIHDTGCSLKVFRSACLSKIKLVKGMHRFLPTLLMIEGYTAYEIPVSHRPRKEGKSNYSLWNRGISTLCDLLGVWWMKRRHIQPEVICELTNEARNGI